MLGDIDKEDCHCRFTDLSQFTTGRLAYQSCMYIFVVENDLYNSPLYEM